MQNRIESFRELEFLYPEIPKSVAFGNTTNVSRGPPPPPGYVNPELRIATMETNRESALESQTNEANLTVVKAIKHRGVVASFVDRKRVIQPDNVSELERIVMASFAAHSNVAGLHIIQVIPYYGTAVFATSNKITYEAILKLNMLPASYRMVDGSEVQFTEFQRENFDGVFSIISTENTAGDLLPAIQNLRGMCPKVDPNNWKLLAKTNEENRSTNETRYLIRAITENEKRSITEATWRIEPRWQSGIHVYRVQTAHRGWESFILKDWGRYIDELCTELNLRYSEEQCGILKTENEHIYFGMNRKHHHSVLQMNHDRR